MAEKTYNINELLDKKKFLEEQIKEKLNVQAKPLTYAEEEVIDRLNPVNNRKVIPQARVTLVQFSEIMNGYIDELAATKAAIQSYNSGAVSKLLQQRESVRSKIEFLKNIKARLPRDMSRGRNVLSQDANNVPVEIVEVTQEPMFPIEDVEKQLNEFAAEERKLNSEIQKMNLDAKISL